MGSLLFNDGKDHIFKVNHVFYINTNHFVQELSVSGNLAVDSPYFSIKYIKNLDVIKVTNGTKLKSRLESSVPEIIIKDGSFDLDFVSQEPFKSTFAYDDKSKITLKSRSGFDLIMKPDNSDVSYALKTDASHISSDDMSMLVAMNEGLLSIYNNEFTENSCNAVKQYITLKNKKLVNDFMESNGIEIDLLHWCIEKNLSKIKSIIISSEEKYLDSLFYNILGDQEGDNISDCSDIKPNGDNSQVDNSNQDII